MSTSGGRVLRRRGKLASVAVLAIFGLVVALPPAGASTMAGSAVVVHEVTRGTFGKILVTATNGATLYVQSTPGPCTGYCLGIWPPLLMPKGKTVPLGATSLGTAKIAGGLQVTYHKKRLYTYYLDTGTSVQGNGVGSFVVAKVS
jgi:predicted lipoprotein with Yx(FWY)xxD motif